MQYITNTDIRAVSVEGERKWRLLLKEKYNELSPQISPDGKWMAYTSNESEQYEVFVRPFPDVESGGRWQVSTGGGASPLWSPDGREIFYRNGDSTMTVDVETDPIFKCGNPGILFRGPYLSSGIIKTTTTPGAIHPNGKKFLMTKPSTTEEREAPAPQPKIMVVLNWFEELKKRVPVD